MAAFTDRCNFRQVRRFDAGEFAFEVVGELGAIAGMMEDAEGVVEDVPLGDLLVVVVFAEMLERPIGALADSSEVSPSGDMEKPFRRELREPGKLWG